MPFLIRAGKCLAKTATEVLVRFHSPPQRSFADQSLDHSQNYIRIRFNPEEIIAIGAVVRKEGEKDGLQPVELMAHRQPVDEVPPYARLLHSAMAGDPSLFAARTSSRPSGRSSSRCSAMPHRCPSTSREAGDRPKPIAFCPRATSGTTLERDRYVRVRELGVHPTPLIA